MRALRSRPALARPPPRPPLDAQPVRIHIRGLGARAIIGVRPGERRKRQDVVLDLSFDTRSRAGRSDRIADAVDYKRVKDAVLAHVERSRWHLLEALAESVADLVLREPGVTAVQVTVDKPGALRFARSVAVEVRRSRAAFAAGEDAA